MILSNHLHTISDTPKISLPLAPHFFSTLSVSLSNNTHAPLCTLSRSASHAPSSAANFSSSVIPPATPCASIHAASPAVIFPAA
jgi:hypothetical protein